ncbi:MAG: hypothetical protein D8M58_22325 [Calditrichaeota bacterium]|nr:MAG: hypothetical protein DWQ03_08495 [Calditrichota bacterium]MBL1208151.1 hypothetical protein [Calditrichota bacterium]NOG47989.1 hypothetical protein [Calditrichota bacterium]
MAKIALSTYTIRIRERREPTYERLDRFDRTTDFFNTFTQYLLNRNQNYSHVQNIQKLISVSNYSVDNRIITGIIKTGEYGYETELFDIQNNEVSYLRSVNEAELLPFFFQVFLPNNADEGILILQRFGQFGIRKAFSNDFNSYFNQLFPDYIVEMNPLLPSQIVDQHLRDGVVTKIRFIKFEVPNDIAEAYDNNGHTEEISSTELVVRAKRNQFLSFVPNRLIEFMNREKDVSNLFELTNFDYDTIKVEVKLDNETRTIDLSDLHKIRAYFDITGDVSINENGHPDYDSILQASNGLLNDLRVALRGQAHE